MEKADVLVLDDETPVLRAVRRALSLEFEIPVATTADPYEAVRILEDQPPKVLVTDFRMPGLDGVQVLEQARLLAPDTVRILLTAQADKRNIIDAINRGKLFRYIAKPWENAHLCEIVRDALATHDAQNRRREERLSLRTAVDHVSELQRALLPAGRLELPGAEAACFYDSYEHASGDYLDAFPLPGNRQALLLGDVCGHGVGAALFVFTARALLRSGLSEGRPLDEVLDRTNRFLCRDMSAGRFLTLFAAIHDPEAGKLHYVNAGQNPPLLLSGGRLRPLTRTGLPFGLVEGTHYELPEPLPFRPGDLLLCYTDGLVEARDADRELYGIERLSAFVEANAALEPQALIDDLRTEVADFSTGPVEDDLTLLAYRAAGKPALQHA